MFEILVRVKVEKNEDGVMGKAVVENTISVDGETRGGGVLTQEFPHALAAYIFVGDYFYDMVEELSVRSSMMKILKPDQN